MAIQFINNIFTLSTDTTSYVMGLISEKYLVQLYYGRKVSSFTDDVESLIPGRLQASGSARDIEGRLSSDLLPVEYPTYGNTDLRTPAFHAIYENGSAITRFEYVSHKTYAGKVKLAGLPSVYAEEEGEAESLEIILRDSFTNLQVVLTYTIYSDFDTLVRSVRIINNGSEVINIKSALAQSTYFFDKNYDFVHLSGGYGTERMIHKTSLSHGTFLVDSKRMSSSHHHSPFIAMARPNATETEGEVYGFSLVYSGNFVMSAETDTYDNVRVNIGIHPHNFNWRLEPGESFQTPEVVSVYASNGYGEMSRRFHHFYRKRLCRGKFRDAHRPILINSWEAAYFDFDEDKLLKLAEKAKEADIEMLVLDDGWFGKRNDDTSSLGDWYVNTEKLPSGLSGLAEKVNQLGLKFGIWMEPEMISPDSELYRKHPDWCIHQPGREGSLGRNQLILDLSRKDVQDYVIDSVANILSSANISYLKWDMNRNASEFGSEQLSADRQQELSHRYFLGLYYVLETLTNMFPEVLFEGCAAGGGRFDPGMLAYFPQYWTSDNSDAISRLYIQYGTSMVMPAITMGAHVSTSPNHQNGRMTPMATRANVAMTGQLGYELNLLEIGEEVLDEIRTQIAAYKGCRDLVCFGDMYRLLSPFDSECSAVSFVSENKDEILLMFCNAFVLKHMGGTINVKLQGIEPEGLYECAETGKQYMGDFLMNRGLYFGNRKDYQSQILLFRKVM